MKNALRQLRFLFSTGVICSIVIMLVLQQPLVHAATITGGEGNDRLIGTAASDTIFARDGDDYIDGRRGDDVLKGGEGKDTIFGGEGEDYLLGEETCNVVDTTKHANDDVMDGGEGMNFFYSRYGDDVIRGGSSIDGVEAFGCGTRKDKTYDRNVDISTGAGNDWVSIITQYSSVRTGAGNDTVRGTAGFIDLGDDDDVFEITEWGLTLSDFPADVTGGNGKDKLNLVDLSGTILKLSGFELITAAQTDFMLDEVNNVEGGMITITAKNVDASKLVGVILKCKVSESASGANLNDIMNGSNNANTFTGNAGNDIINGGDGRDIAIYSGNTTDYTVIEKAYNTFEVTDNRADSPDGTDTIIDINVLQFADGVTSISIPGLRIIGDNTAEEINGGTNSDYLDGAGGNDMLFGDAGNDTILGGIGDDQLTGGTGDDSIDGGTGVDTVDFALSGTLAVNPVTVNMTTGTASGAAIGIDSLKNVENIRGSNSNDILTGNSGNNSLTGGGGNDIMTGAAGRDTLTGSGGADRFVYTTLSDTKIGITQRDIITDFNATNSDKIDLSFIDAYSKTSGNQAFTYIASSSFSGLKGEVRFENGILQINTGSDRVADMEIELRGIKSFAAGMLIP
ncbi:MAG: hypothetical protein RLY87_468 [Chloroflexota bacterium]|jgi:Ca2+-binding RTX toxin-like protein